MLKFDFDPNKKEVVIFPTNFYHLISVRLLEKPAIGFGTPDVAEVVQVPALSRYDRSTCIAGPSSVQNTLMPQLRTIPPVTVSNPFPLSCPASDPLQPKFTAFTPVTQR